MHFFVLQLFLGLTVYFLNFLFLSVYFLFLSTTLLFTVMNCFSCTFFEKIIHISLFLCIVVFGCIYLKIYVYFISCESLFFCAFNVYFVKRTSIILCLIVGGEGGGREGEGGGGQIKCTWG